MIRPAFLAHHHKTLVAWVSLANIEQRGVGVLSLVNMPVPQFDGIVFGELAPANGWPAAKASSTDRKNQSACPVETADPTNSCSSPSYTTAPITIYRNGQQYAQYDTANEQILRERFDLADGQAHLDRGMKPLAPSNVGRRGGRSPAL